MSPPRTALPFVRRGRLLALAAAWACAEDRKAPAGVEQDSALLTPSSPTEPASTTPEETVQVQDTGQASPADTADSAGPPYTGPTGVRGNLVGPDGAPLTRHRVLGCTRSTCLQGETDSAGAFAFDLAPGTLTALKTIPDLLRVPRWGAALRPAVVGAGAPLVVEDLYVPDLPTGARLSVMGPDHFTEVGDGLELALDPEALHAEPGVFLYDVAARRLPTERLAPYQALLPDEQVLAVYALHPFGTHSDRPIAVAAPVDLADGRPLQLRVIDHLDGSFGPVVRGEAADGRGATTLETGIDRLTWLVLSAP